MSTQQAEVQSEAAQTRRAVSNILKGSAGNLVEWYDLYVYTVFAAYFQSHFFNSTGRSPGRPRGDGRLLDVVPHAPHRQPGSSAATPTGRAARLR